MTGAKTPGQLAYERDVAKRPLYPNGGPRKLWHELPDYARWSWERDPTDREYTAKPAPPA